MRWIVLGLAVLINLAVLAWAAAPMLVTYAEVPPREVTCDACASPEVQRALARAAAAGRAQVLVSLERIFPVLVGVSVINVALLALFIVLRRQRSAA